MGGGNTKGQKNTLWTRVLEEGSGTRTREEVDRKLKEARPMVLAKTWQSCVRYRASRLDRLSRGLDCCVCVASSVASNVASTVASNVASSVASTVASNVASTVEKHC